MVIFVIPEYKESTGILVNALASRAPLLGCPNICTNSDWDTDQYMLRIHNGMKYCKYTLRVALVLCDWPLPTTCYIVTAIAKFCRRLCSFSISKLTPRVFLAYR